MNINTSQLSKKINLNTASKEELQSLPNIGEKYSQLIIDNRPYSSVWDLKKIKGIGEKTIRLLEKEVIVE